jgi:glycogen synthase kinase 3 beta
VKNWVYRPLTILGRGSFGVVYKSFGPTGQEVAVKKVKVDRSGGSRELTILEMLHSPFCLTLIDYFYVPDADPNNRLLCLVTELMPESLGNLIRAAHQMSSPLPPLLVKAFSYQLLAGLAHVHSLGIAHRDIKTDNCLVDPPRGRLKIIDFGTAKHVDSGVPNASYVASRIYRAPELLLNSTLYGAKIDIWAAGCVIAEILLTQFRCSRGSRTRTTRSRS